MFDFKNNQPILEEVDNLDFIYETDIQIKSYVYNLIIESSQDTKETWLAKIERFFKFLIAKVATFFKKIDKYIDVIFEKAYKIISKISNKVKSKMDRTFVIGMHKNLLNPKADPKRLFNALKKVIDSMQGIDSNSKFDFESMGREDRIIKFFEENFNYKGDVTSKEELFEFMYGKYQDVTIGYKDRDRLIQAVKDTEYIKKEFIELNKLSHTMIMRLRANIVKENIHIKINKGVGTNYSKNNENVRRLNIITEIVSMINDVTHILVGVLLNYILTCSLKASDIQYR